MPMRGSAGTAVDFFAPKTSAGDFFGADGTSFWLGASIGIPPRLKLAGKILIEILPFFPRTKTRGDERATNNTEKRTNTDFNTASFPRFIFRFP
jgi:hypothetical protein